MGAPVPIRDDIAAEELRRLARQERVMAGCYDDILDACCAAWNALLAETGRIRPLCALDWAAPVRT